MSGYNKCDNMIFPKIIVALIIILSPIISLASKAERYDDDPFVGMSRKVLVQHLVNEGRTHKNLLYQNDFKIKDFTDKGGNIVYVIKYDFELAENITIPANCILQFDGGSIRSGGTNRNTITGQNTRIQAGLYKILDTNLIIDGKWNIVDWKLEWFANIVNGLDVTKIIQSCIDMTAVTCLEVPSGWYMLSGTVIIPENKRLKMQGHRVRYLLDSADVDPTETRIISEGIKEGYLFDVRNKSSIVGGAIIPGSDMVAGGAIHIDIGKYRISSVFLQTDLCIRESKNYLSSNLTAIFIDGNYKKGGDNHPCGENLIFDVNITGFKNGIYLERLYESKAPQLVWFNNYTITGWMAMCQRYMYSNCNTENHAGGAGYNRFSIQGAKVNDESTPAIEWGGNQNVFDVTFHDISPSQSQKIRYKLKGNHTFIRRQKCDATVVLPDYNQASLWYTFEESPVIQELEAMGPNCSKSIEFISGYIEHSGHKHSVYLRCRINGAYTREQLLRLPHISRNVVYSDCFAETTHCICHIEGNGLFLKGTAYNSLLNIRIDYIDNDI